MEGIKSTCDRDSTWNESSRKEMKSTCNCEAHKGCSQPFYRHVAYAGNRSTFNNELLLASSLILQLVLSGEGGVIHFKRHSI